MSLGSVCVQLFYYMLPSLYAYLFHPILQAEMQKDSDGNQYWEVSPRNASRPEVVLIYTRFLANAAFKSRSLKATR